MSVVFRGRLAESLRFGHALLIAGKTCEAAERFEINLSAQEKVTDLNTNRILSILFDLDKDTITLQHHSLDDVQSSNEHSENIEYSNFLNQFTIFLVIGHEKLYISINEQPTLDYPHQMRVSPVNVLEVKGDLEYIRHIDHRQYFPYPWPPIQLPERRLHFSNDVPMPFQTGHVMVISAHLKGNDMGRFILHLRNVWDNERQEVHVSVRFDTKVVVRTSKTLEDEEHFSFDEEERGRHFPFSSFFEPFKLAIGFAKHGVKFAKDGIFLFTFTYRTLDVLPCIAGLKMFGIDGAVVHVSGVDHLRMDDAFCIDFEEYSKL